MFNYCFCHAVLCISAAYAFMQCPVRLFLHLSVCHICVFCRKLLYLQNYFAIW